MSKKSEFDPNQLKSIEKVALSIDRCQGNYAFLVGAGTSRAAGIKTANELIGDWQQEEYERVDPDLEKSDWIQKNEEDILDHQNKYGYWFEEAYTTREERRRFIKGLVEDVDPTFEHIVLSSLMLREYVPITLTPNFDDLIYNAFYSYLEERPLLVDHNALAPQFKIVYGDPMIVKLHGDYLYDNLKNTGAETDELEENINDVLEKVLGEYGLIVLGYSGRDESIMSILNSEEIDIPDQGLYWCTTNKENLSSKTEELLEKENTYLVEIESSMDFFYKLYENLEDLSVPTPVDVRERANKRADQLEEGIINVGGVETLGLAREYNRRDEYQNSIELLNRAIESGVQDYDVYQLRSDVYKELGNYEAAIDDLSHVISLLDEDMENCDNDEEMKELGERKCSLHNNRGIIHATNGRYEKACEEFEQCVNMENGSMLHQLNHSEAKILAGEIGEGIAIAQSVQDESDDSNRIAKCLLLKSVGNILLDDEYEEEKELLNELSDDGYSGGWNFDELHYFLDNKITDENKLDNIEEIESIYTEGVKDGDIIPDKLVAEFKDMELSS